MFEFHLWMKIMNKKHSVLVIAEAANPEWVSVPLVGWSLSYALRNICDIHIVTQIRNRKAFLRKGLIEGIDFTTIDSEAIEKPVRRFANLIRGGKSKGWTTVAAFKAFTYYYFEYLVWKKFGSEIRDKKYDVVHRITPLSPTTPSTLAKKCYNSDVPFVLGPLNGGAPWPKEFDTERRKENEWLSYVRNVYKFLPGYKNTLKYSSAMIIGSKDTLNQIPSKYHNKCIYIPENAIDPDKFSLSVENHGGSGVLRACFVGRLVAYKCPDILLSAALPLIKEGKLELDIIGDGPLMPVLVDMIKSNNIISGVRLTGWVEHSAIQDIMCKSHVFSFPSIREFGGGVVLEAMALGLVPLIVDYAGPGELVDDHVGLKIPLESRKEITLSLRNKLTWIIGNKVDLRTLSMNAKKRVFDLYTWDKKASQIHSVYDWVCDNKIEKPQFFN